MFDVVYLVNNFSGKILFDNGKKYTITLLLYYVQLHKKSVQGFNMIRIIKRSHKNN